jgi:hypothetical protein
MFGANRGRCRLTSPTSASRWTRRQDLVVNASFEGLHDGDDYIEGNGGNDVIFGGRGQDDIIGGSSNLYGSLITEPDDRNQRPDGSDLIFGGAGTDIDAQRHRRRDRGRQWRHHVTTAGGHAHDADVIIGDNGQIFRLVGINGVQRGTGDITRDGVRSTGGYLNFNYDYEAASQVLRATAADGNDDTYDYIVVRAVEFLDYTEGGIDISDAAATTSAPPTRSMAKRATTSSTA